MSNVHWQPGMTIAEVEEQVIRKAFSFFEKSKPKTAASLDIAIRTLDARLAKINAKDAAKEELNREE